jgi:hypothetical protein
MGKLIVCAATMLLLVKGGLAAEPRFGSNQPQWAALLCHAAAVYPHDEAAVARAEGNVRLALPKNACLRNSGRYATH